MTTQTKKMEVDDSKEYRKKLLGFRPLLDLELRTEGLRSKYILHKAREIAQKLTSNSSQYLSRHQHKEATKTKL